MIRNICLILVIAAMSAISSPSLHAQGKIDREQWMNEIQQYKRGYFAKELGLTKEQQDKFFPLYEEMEQQTHRIEEESRIMEKRVSEADDATALEYEKATEALYDAKVKEADLEREYMVKFKEILDSKQLFELKAVERKFTREMMRQHHRIRSSRVAETR